MPDPQGYPVQEYLNLIGDIVFQIWSNGNIVYKSLVIFASGTTSPEGSVTAPVGSFYIRTDGTWWQKQTGSGNTGWVSLSLGPTPVPTFNDNETPATSVANSEYDLANTPNPAASVQLFVNNVLFVQGVDWHFTTAKHIVFDTAAIVSSIKAWYRS